ncbi:hypothetical protein K4H28_12140 [Deefgea tanakiae]|uniref:Uncharacterized protein n=1 Tax=Deefgea tanakiae TaxID=2865840 RepID=A0ABX8Z390_9NEIS|nr:hypothetical protein [Deefgea tanakiae]QZA77043.1 hypothetical protein K4H28_12140 [Deefgea tanakiae]
MTTSNAQRQAKYRQQRHAAGADGNGERRLNTYISTGASLALNRLARHYGVTKREMLERLIVVQDEIIKNGLDLDSPEWDVYHRITA